MSQEVVRLVMAFVITGFLISSGLLPMTPLSADVLSWSAETIPSSSTMLENKVIESGDTIIDMAVSDGGNTIYTLLTSNKLYKSTNAGVSWTALTSPSTDQLGLIAVAPDDGNLVVVVDTIDTPAGSDDIKVYISEDGGLTFASMGTPTDDSSNNMTAALSLDISNIADGVHYVAVGGSVNNTASLSYFDYGAPLPKWFDANDPLDWSGVMKATPSEVRAVAFSPNFPSDKIIGVITANTTFATFQIGSFSEKRWNSDIEELSGYPVAIASITNLTEADISFDSRYLGSSQGTRILFIGLEHTGGGNAPGGIYRLSDYTLKVLKVGTGNAIKSVAINSDGTVLIAGNAANNEVYYSNNPRASTPSFSTATTYKRPGIDGKTTDVIARWFGGNVVTASSGSDGGFSVSRDGGKTFNDISLVHTAATNIRDFAVSPDGTRLYLLTDDGTDMSLWRKSSSWERVLAWTPHTVNWIVRPNLNNFDSVYLAETGNTTMYYSSDSGQTKWNLRYSDENIQDMAVDNNGIVYVAVQGTRNVLKLKDISDFTWEIAVTTGLPGNIHMLKFISSGKIIAGSDNGYVSYSVDGAFTWNLISPRIYSGATYVKVTASGLSGGDYIYAVSNTTDQGVYRWEIGSSTSWQDIILGDLTGGGWGLALGQNSLYVIATSGADSRLHRVISADSAGSSSLWSDDFSGGEKFNRAPQALGISSGTKLWAIHVNTGVGTDTADKLFSFSDTISGVGPQITGPASDAIIPMNNRTGIPQDVVYTWDRLSKVTDYDLDISLNEAFTEIIWTERSLNNTNDTVVFIFGHGSAFSASVGGRGETYRYMTGVTYYWRIRAREPLLSPWSNTSSFRIGQLDTLELTIPAIAATDVPLQPTFIWNQVDGVVSYEIAVSDNYTFDDMVLNASSSGFLYEYTENLTGNTTYYWRVRGIYGPKKAAGQNGGAGFTTPWKTGVFTTIDVPKDPVPSLIIKNVEAPPGEVKTVTIPVPTATLVPDYLIWAIIGVGTLLIASIIALVIRTGRIRYR